MDLMKSIAASASGMNAQSLRMKIISENIANADSVESEDGGPYRRKIAALESYTDRKTGLQHARIGKVVKDEVTPFREVHDPGHRLADANGIVKYPNVNTLVESTDMREAARAYEANMSAVEAAKEMMVRSLDLLR